MVHNQHPRLCRPVLLVLLTALLGGCGLVAAGGGGLTMAGGPVSGPPRPAVHHIVGVWSLDDLPHPLNLPVALAVDRHGDLYVVDAGHDRIQKFDRDGRFLARWGETGDGAGQFRFRRPDRCDDRDREYCTPDVGGGVAIDGDDNVYVADYGNSRVQKFDRDGRFQTGWGGEGSGPGEFLLPRGIAVDGQGRIWVSDWANHRVQQFDRSGRFLTTWGQIIFGDDGPERPAALAVDRHGHLYVADTARSLVQQFDQAGRRLSQWRWAATSDDDPDDPTKQSIGVATGADGRLFVADNDRVRVYGRDGAPLASWGGGGPGQGQFQRPVAVALDGAGHLYVADQAADRVDKFRLLPPTR